MTERQRQQDLLLKQEREFRTLAESLPDNIVRYDREGRALYLNSVMEKTLEYTTADRIGLCIREWHPDQSYEILAQAVDDTLASGRTNEIELVLPESGEDPIVHQIRTIAERDERGEVVGVLAIGRDITQRKRSEKELREKQQRLHDLALELAISEQRERRRLASDLHDSLGQELTLAKIKIGSLTKMGLQAKQKKLLAEISRLTESSIDRVRSLTRQLCPPILESAGLEAALKWLARQLQADYGLQITFDDDQLSKSVLRDFQMELYTCVRELLINVVKHAGTTTAYLSLSRQADMLTIQIEDDGVGFEAESILNNPAIDGFGLYTIKHRIAHMGGSFRIHSILGSGTEVTIKVPLEKDALQGEMT